MLEGKVTVGIDIGAENAKAVILCGCKILSYSIVPQGMTSSLSIAERVFKNALEDAEIKSSEVSYVVVTGAGAQHITFANAQVGESVCCCRGVALLFGSTKGSTIVDMGADKCLVVKCDNGKPISTVRNDRCASGTGRFLTVAAKVLGVSQQELGILSLKSTKDVNINNTCVVFAESEIISLVHLKYAKEDIARAVFRGLAQRIYAMLLKVGFESEVIMVGGHAKNIGMVKAVEEQTNSIIHIPEEPLIVGALGAAVIAAERSDRV